MMEKEFEAFLYADPQINSDKAVATRMSKARKAESILQLSLDVIVASDDLTYDSLVILKQHENPRNAPLSNALRKYYIFKNTKGFPQLRMYRR
jgi:hypothetical protein